MYQIDESNQQAQTDPNAISSSAEIIVGTLLSATVHDVEDGALDDLEENITISFQRAMVLLCKRL